MGMEKKVEAMVLSLSFEVEVGTLEKKTMETLNPMGVFIGFPIRLKRLEPTKGLGHLI